MRGGLAAVVNPLIPVEMATMGAIAVAAPSAARRVTVPVDLGSATLVTPRNSAATGKLAVGSVLQRTPLQTAYAEEHRDDEGAEQDERCCAADVPVVARDVGGLRRDDRDHCTASDDAVMPSIP